MKNKIVWYIIAMFFAQNTFAQFTLNFEDATQNDFVENGHKFTVQTEITDIFAKEGLKSWQSNEKSGNFGALRVIEGSIDLKSFWVRRPWGTYDAIVKGLRNGQLKYEKVIDISTDFQQVSFENWQDIDQIVLESGKKYNQFYVDVLEYDYRNTEQLLTSAKTENTLELLENLPPILPKDSEGNQLYLLDFEDVPQQKGVFVANEHHFELASSAVQMFPHSGLDSWQLNEHEGNKGYLKMVTGLLNIQSFWIRRPWGNFEAVIRAFKGDQEVYKKNIMVNQDYQKVELNWINIDKIEVSSIQKFNQIYIDDILYSVSKQENDTISEKKHDVSFKDNRYILDFEGELLEDKSFAENGHSFNISTQIFDKYARNGLFCWQANDVNGNFGFLEIKEGNFDLHSLGIRRPWGVFEAIIKAYKGENLLHTQNIMVNSDYQTINFENWRNIERITVESVKKFNQLYIDEVQYSINNHNENIITEKTKINTIKETDFSPKTLKKQEIKLQGIENKAFGDKNFQITALTSSGKDAKISILQGALQKVSDNFFQITGVGKVKILVTVEGDNLYEATQQEFEFNIQKSKQTLHIENIPDLFLGGESHEIKAQASSGLEAHFEVVKGDIKIFGNMIIVQKKTGKAIIRVIQNGNELYHAAKPLEISFKVLKKKFLNRNLF